MKYSIAAALLCLAAPAHAACGLTSWYGMESGPYTASGERFKPNGLTAAHRTLPFGTTLLVCRLPTRTTACVVVRVNDRGPAKWTRRGLDLSRSAARALGMVKAGVVRTCWNENEVYLSLEMMAQTAK